MGILDKIKENKFAFGGASVVLLGVLGWLAFGFFGIQAAFIDNVVDEEGPVFDAIAQPAQDVSPSDDAAAVDVPEVQAAGSADAGPDAEASAAINDAPDDAVELAADPAVESDLEVVADVVTEAPVEDAPVQEAAAETTEAPVGDAPVQDAAPETTEAPPETTEAPAATEAPPEPGQIVTTHSGNFSSLNGYSVEGAVRVLGNGTAQRFLEFPDLNAQNGPDLKVYLRADNGEFISLGDLKGNIGSQNYEIPADVDLSVFSNVEIWCERFSAGFGVATLAAA